MVDAITLVVEGRTDEAVGKRLLADAGIAVTAVYGLKGKNYLDERLRGYNNAARFSPWIVLRDLNSDKWCAALLRDRLLPAPAPLMRLHIVVRAVEAWLLADNEALSEFLGVPIGDLPAKPEDLPHPKATLIDLARNSRKRAIRDGLVPVAGSTAKVGPGFAAMIAEFATGVWRPESAARRCESLMRLLRHLDSLRGAR
jgi:hypothetical protein